MAAHPATRVSLEVLRRLGRVESEWGVAAIVDTETTGLDPRRHEVLELAVVLFAFDRVNGTVHGIVEEYSGLQEPCRPIDPDAQRVHGITQDAVRGCSLDLAHVERLLSRAEFLISHNARFDRGFVCRLFPQVARRLWLCSMSGVPWYARGHTSRSLAALLRDHALPLANAHRALDDARATLALLASAGPSGETNLSVLLRLAALDDPPCRSQRN